ncbi:MAG TPA: GNAT family protein [Rhabdochlamydiaceae bacterium]|jgi:RimJ/RimL family protein N-acetyltransferase|nr:GNAT family protein [Rhabdochlamydiaceae bacterium]
MAMPPISDIDTAVIDFYKNGSPITIETKDLVLRSVQENHLGFFQNLFTDPVTMRLYTDNEKRYEQSPDTWKAKQMQSAAERVATFVKRWTVDKIPFSGFLICKKKDLSPIGFIVAGFGNKPGQLETAFVITEKEQRQGFGTQAVYAIVRRYVPALIANHYKLFNEPLLADKVPVNEVVATARLDNIASMRVMEKAGMVKIDENPNDWGQVRGVYSYKYENPPLV